MALVVCGISATLVAQNQPSIYKLTWRGKEFSLRSDISPDAYIRLCLQARLSTPSISSDALRATCLKLMLVWGENLVSNFGRPFDPKDPVASPLGRNFLDRAFALLADDLARRSGQDLESQLRIHNDLEMEVEWAALKEEYKTTLQPVAARYYLAVWQSLPASPTTFPEFTQKLRAGEQLKQLYLPNVIPADASFSTILEFYQSAFIFHQRPAPDVTGQAGARSLPVLLNAPGLAPAVGYTVFPGEAGLQPVHELPADDLERASALLQYARSNKLLPESEVNSKLQEIERQTTAFEIAWTYRWIERLERRKDRYGIAASRTRIRELYIKNGDKAKALQEQKQVCALLEQIGERQEWAVQTVALAYYLADTKQWQAVLQTLAPVKDALYESGQYEGLLTALELEKSAYDALGRPEPNNDWRAKVKTLLPDVQNLPEVTGTANDSPEQKVKNAKAWLAQPGHAEPWRVPVQIRLANALQSLRRYSEAEGVTSDVVSELAGQRRKMKEFEALSALFGIESKGGNVGHFYSTLRQYEDLGRELYGEDWIQTSDGLEIARVLYDLGDVHRAESVLDLQMEQERLETMRGTKFAEISDDDLLLQARIDLELGRSDEAEEIVHSLSKAGRHKSSELVMQLADLDAALGKNEDALEKAELLLKTSAKDPADDLELWMRATLTKARSQLALSRDAGELVARFEELAPQFTQYKDLDALQAVEMEIFLGDYYAWKRNDAKAVEWLKKGLVLADELGATDQRIEIHRKLGEEAEHSGNWKDAIDEYRKSVNLVNSISTTIPSDLGKVGYRGGRNKATALLVVALYNEYRRTAERQSLLEMWQAVENGKSRALSEDVMAQANRGINRLSLDDVRARLSDNGELLEFYIPEGAADVIFRFTIDRQAALVDALPVKASELTAKVEALKTAAEDSADSYNETAFRNQCSELGKILLPQRWKMFQASETQQLYIVPAGALYLFPFSLLADEQGRFLDEYENIQITYVPNATLILRHAPRFAEASHSLAFVNPGRDDEHSSFLDSDPALRREFERALTGWSGVTLYWQRPFTARELLAEAEKADNVFVYSHGRFVPEDPVSSYIRLSDDGGAASMLSAADILNAKLGHGLWVLAACSTGAGRVRSGDEVLGLPRALLERGASMVVIPLWDVHVSSSWRMMTLFYNYLATGLPVSQALHAASATLRKEHNPPFDWAPFILVGQHGFTN